MKIELITLLDQHFELLLIYHKFVNAIYFLEFKYEVLVNLELLRLQLAISECGKIRGRIGIPFLQTQKQRRRRNRDGEIAGY